MAKSKDGSEFRTIYPCVPEVPRNNPNLIGGKSLVGVWMIANAGRHTVCAIGLKGTVPENLIIVLFDCGRKDGSLS